MGGTSFRRALPRRGIALSEHEVHGTALSGVGRRHGQQVNSG
jgi:hypothetical protein